MFKQTKLLKSIFYNYGPYGGTNLAPCGSTSKNTLGNLIYFNKKGKLDRKI